ncbi:hypothetical protein DPMN_117946 [Dreissena polymorpha]|uniref:Uncharacterized protein n=1 Tax=Dreissena polymorpha TaxID=45954 RepID=A0A9D4GFZ7_DREPO|nr:hypothetical protein DPMN_117946 [Dreissena polymorpha]
MDSLSKLILQGTKKKLSITTTELTIEDGAVINLNGGGFLADGTGSSTTKVGASYGGVGGSNSTSASYGSTNSPADYGSGTSSARGGGIIDLSITGTAEIDGSLSVEGLNGTTSGGASGGSIKIKAATLQGHGKLSAIGGSTAAASGGGGGGGRIAIDATTMTSFLGDVSVCGGAGASGGSPGAAGTIYKKYQQSGGAQFETVTVDNCAQVSESFTHVSGVQSMTDLVINGHGQVKFDGTLPVTINKILGDYSGTLTISSGQTFSIATSYGTLSPYALMCKIVIKEGGLATIPSKILLKDDDATGKDWYNLEIYGTVIGVREMTVSSGGRVVIHSKSRSGLDTSNLKPIGTLGFNNIDVTMDGILELSLDSMDRYTLSMVKQFNVKYGGKVEARNLFISSPVMEVAYGGLLSVDRGNMNDGKSPGGNGNSGAGGTHGGKGGDSTNGMKPLSNFEGLFNQATEFGSAGGNGTSETGAKGGGYIILEINTLLTVEGTISANGGSANSTSGGGSGGAIHVQVIKDMKGSGMLSVTGGSSVSGGGGGGGRIFIDVDGDFHFQGNYKLHGGSSTSGQAGGSGTTYAIVQEAGSPGYVENFFFDNSGAKGAVDGVSYIDVKSANLYTVNNLNLGGSTRVWLFTPNLHFKAKTLTCGSRSTIVVGDNTVFSPDYELTYSAIMCSFDLKQDGELRLPKSVELKGEASSLEGMNILRCFLTFYNFI